MINEFTIETEFQSWPDTIKQKLQELWNRGIEISKLRYLEEKQILENLATRRLVKKNLNIYCYLIDLEERLDAYQKRHGQKDGANVVNMIMKKTKIAGQKNFFWNYYGW